MPFTAEQVEVRDGHAGAPDPGRDVHWYRVKLGPDRFGWAWSPGSQPRPTAGQVAEQLNVLEPRLGRALEGRMRGGGVELRPPLDG